MSSFWEGRSWVDYNISTGANGSGESSNQKLVTSDTGTTKLVTRNTVRFLSYHLLADSKILTAHYSATKNWEVRSQLLLREIKSYEADIICLQDVDHFPDFWRPQLMLMGYDSVYQMRTQTKNIHYEGVAICYKRDIFQLFKTVPIEFNASWDFDTTKSGSFQERCKTDDVGLLLFLQPWKQNYLTSALCIGTAMLCDNIQNADVRMLHTHYFVHKIEEANSAFHLPVLLGLSLNDNPPSLAYNLLRTGRIPLSAAIPQKPSKPNGAPTCRGSVLLKWFPPPMTPADPPITEYAIRWRPGGNRALGFESTVEVGTGDCVKYAYRTDAEGNKKIYAVEELQFVVPGLVSDIPYEFRVSAVNEVGEGFPSDTSEPVLMMNPLKAPKMPGLQSLMSMNEVFQLRELSDMMAEDWNVNVSGINVKKCACFSACVFACACARIVC
jgi:hypothetical protein